MADVIIRNMEIPANCTACRLRSNGWCYALPEDEHQPGPCRHDNRPEWCPIGEELYHSNTKRLEELLVAAYRLLRKQEDSPYVLNLLTETVFYDDAECDGLCLMVDIETALEERGIATSEVAKRTT